MDGGPSLASRHRSGFPRSPLTLLRSVRARVRIAVIGARPGPQATEEHHQPVVTARCLWSVALIL